MTAKRHMVQILVFRPLNFLNLNSPFSLPISKSNVLNLLISIYYNRGIILICVLQLLRLSCLTDFNGWSKMTSL